MGADPVLRSEVFYMSSQPMNHGSSQPEVHRITEARESHTTERDSRVRKYTISMTVRLVCFILAFFFDGWLRWVLLAGAIVLPYIAVVIANGGADLTKREPPAEFYKAPDAQAIAAPEEAAPAEQQAQEPEVIDGSFAEEAEPVHQPTTAPKED